MRRADPERIYQAKLAGLRGRIVRQWHQSDDRADALLAEWDREATTRPRSSEAGLLGRGGGVDRGAGMALEANVRLDSREL
jgi:hypothetical protein